MKTTMNIPKDLLREAVELSGAGTQTMAVVLGLHELIKRKRLEKLADLQGSDAIKLDKKEIANMRKR